MVMKQSRAFVAQRRETIARMLRKQGRISVTSLAEQLGISPLTVRRDLDYLEEQGIATRRYGEAILSPTGLGQAGSLRELAKAAIADAAAAMVNDGESLFINTSSTALMIVERIKASDVTVVTNSAKAQELSIPATTTVLVTGGEIRAPRGVLSGEFALSNIRSVSASTCFVGCAGISENTGVTSATLQEATVNSLMAERSDRVILLADSSKLGMEAGFTYLPLHQVDLLITDSGAEQGDLDRLLEAGVRSVKVVEPVAADQA